jgi:hypothetical protein
MLTSHLLFVGFGFADADFLAMSGAVQRVRSLAQEDTANAKVGTAIELRESTKRRYAELDYQHLSPADSNVAEAARLLEILLDRLAWRAQITGDIRASFLLDPDYQQGANPNDEELRQKLTERPGPVAQPSASPADHDPVSRHQCRQQRPEGVHRDGLKRPPRALRRNCGERGTNSSRRGGVRWCYRTPSTSADSSRVGAGAIGIGQNPGPGRRRLARPTSPPYSGDSQAGSESGTSLVNCQCSWVLA